MTTLSEHRGTRRESVFGKFEDLAWPHRFAGHLHVGTILGGTPNSSKVTEGWLRKKLTDGKIDAQDEQIREMVAEVMIERGYGREDLDKAIEETVQKNSVNGFLRDEHGLYIEGRQLKAAIKEAAMVAVAAGRIDAKGWGATRKGLRPFIAEHIFVVQDRLYLGKTEHDGISQRFCHTWTGSSITLEEFVTDAEIDFTIKTDFDFGSKFWPQLWLTGQEQGIGASRSQGFGRYEVTEWVKLS